MRLRGDSLSSLVVRNCCRPTSGITGRRCLVIVCLVKALDESPTSERATRAQAMRLRMFVHWACLAACLTALAAWFLAGWRGVTQRGVSACLCVSVLLRFCLSLFSCRNISRENPEITKRGASGMVKT